MAIEDLIVRWKAEAAGVVTPVTPGDAVGVTKSTEVNQLHSLENVAPVTRVTPVTPKNDHIGDLAEPQSHPAPVASCGPDLADLHAQARAARFLYELEAVWRAIAARKAAGQEQADGD